MCAMSACAVNGSVYTSNGGSITLDIDTDFFCIHVTNKRRAKNNQE